MDYTYSKERSKWLDKKDDIILKRIEKTPEREKELLTLSDKADLLIMENRKHNYNIENRGRVI